LSRPIIPRPKYHIAGASACNATAPESSVTSGREPRVIEIDDCLIATANQLLHRAVAALGSRTRYRRISSRCRRRRGRSIVVVGKPAEILFQEMKVPARIYSTKPATSAVSSYGPNWRKTWGQAAISVIVEHGISMKVDADVFTQVNAEGNRKILSELLAAGEFQSQDRVLELYSGAGNFTLSIAKRVAEVVAVEGSRLSIQNGKLSAQGNGIENIRWVCSPPAALSLKTTPGKVYPARPRSAARRRQGP
jgi:hypothetical protein